MDKCRYCGSDDLQCSLEVTCKQCGARTNNFTSTGGDVQSEKQFAVSAWNRGNYWPKDDPKFGGEKTVIKFTPKDNAVVVRFIDQGFKGLDIRPTIHIECKDESEHKRLSKFAQKLGGAIQMGLL